MNRNSNISTAAILCLLFWTFAQVSLKGEKIPDEITIMSWNVQNLFDTVDDPRTKDEEFTPTGYRHWTKRHLWQKLFNLTDIIRRVNYGRGPAILGAMEIENFSVLEKLAEHSNLKKSGYRYRYLRNGQDIRGIDVALISRYRASVKWHSVYYGGRDILEAKVVIAGVPLYVLVNHWRSRRGGKKKTLHRRVLAAKKCRRIVRKILRRRREADIVLLGDFNDNPDDPSIAHYLGAVPYRGKRERSLLYNLVFEAGLGDPSSRYPHFFDQIIVSRGLLDDKGFSYIDGSFDILSDPPLQNKSGYPLRFSQKTGAGYSDHFPVLARFRIHTKN